MIKYKPTLFSPPMVEAIENDRKTMTRRIIDDKVVRTCEQDATLAGTTIQEQLVKKAKYQRGDVMWVKETFYAYGKWEMTTDSVTGKKKWSFNDLTGLRRMSYYYEHNIKDSGVKVVKKRKIGEIGYYKRPSIFMPRTAARRFLEVTNVRAERLQEISHEDAIAEGIIPLGMSIMQVVTMGQQYLDYSKRRKLLNDGLSPTESFKSLWESLNGPESWKFNPWVWVYEFVKLDRPVRLNIGKQLDLHTLINESTSGEIQSIMSMFTEYLDANGYSYTILVAKENESMKHINGNYSTIRSLLESLINSNENVRWVISDLVNESYFEKI